MFKSMLVHFGIFSNMVCPGKFKIRKVFLYILVIFFIYNMMGVLQNNAIQMAGLCPPFFFERADLYINILQHF